MKSSLRVVDDVVGAERAHQLDVARAAHAGDFGAVVLGDLHGERADAAGRAVDQHLLSRLDLALVAQALQCGDRRDRHGRSLLERHVGGLQRDARGSRARRRTRRHAPSAPPNTSSPGLKLRDVLADGFDGAGEVDADARVLRRAEARATAA